MKIAMFYHSLVSDWNHGNAHFLRGIAAELQDRGHEVRIYEPENGWSLKNLTAGHGQTPIMDFHLTFPRLISRFYRQESLDLESELDDVDLVLVHEWNTHELVAAIGAHRSRHSHYRLFFHDTHHRVISEPGNMRAYDLSAYDGVLAYGEAIREIYEKNGWSRQAWTWHEAADTRIFRPLPRQRRPPEGDLVWIGNWGDEERTGAYIEFLLEPAHALGLKAKAYGVQYPPQGLRMLAENHIEYGGWLANHKVPAVFAKFLFTLHIPRQPYVHMLKGIPTIRPFEALACGIPLICANWEDSEHLFTPGSDYLVARNGWEMKKHMRTLLSDPDRAGALAAHGRRTILSRHTCAHRVDELMNICAETGMKGCPVPDEAASGHVFSARLD